MHACSTQIFLGLMTVQELTLHMSGNAPAPRHVPAQPLHSPVTALRRCGWSPATRPRSLGSGHTPACAWENCQMLKVQIAHGVVGKVMHAHGKVWLMLGTGAVKFAKSKRYHSAVKHGTYIMQGSINPASQRGCQSAFTATHPYLATPHFHLLQQLACFS